MEIHNIFKESPFYSEQKEKVSPKRISFPSGQKVLCQNIAIT